MKNELINTIILLVILAEASFVVAHILMKNRKNRRTDKIFVDTSTLIDGRILGVAQTGFITDDLLIPRSVLRELQLLADGKDSEKRTRARFGLDIVNELERTVEVNAYIHNDAIDGSPVDDRLIELAKANGGAIMTNDFNLNKVATAEGVKVLNVNDLALTLRSEHLPGENGRVKIMSRGNNHKQGVGYLSDGTMVVVEEAGRKVGDEVAIEFIRSLQTPAGKMMFARLKDQPKSNDQQKPKGQKPQPSARRNNRQHHES